MPPTGESPVAPARWGTWCTRPARRFPVTAGGIVATACVAAFISATAGVPAALLSSTAGPGAASGAPTTGTRTSVVSAGGLSVTLTVAPARTVPGATIEFKVGVSDRRATGAVGYVLHFGDGSISSNPIPMFCRAGPGSPAHETWRISHRYRRGGVYLASASGFANCKPARVTAKVRIAIS